MRDYPNMSYCMVENTLAAMNQILEAIEEEGSINFYTNLSRDEKKAFKRLVDVMDILKDEAEYALEEEMSGV